MARIKKLRVNGTDLAIDADPQSSLLTVLREQLDLTGSKYGCGEGQCGACTVLINGTARRSCITAVGSTEGREITTIEGLEHHGRLHPVQEAFLAEGAALQCAYCASGMILSAVSFLKTNPRPSEQEISAAMEGNLCRCGTHPRIIAAILRAAQAHQEAGA